MGNPKEAYEVVQTVTDHILDHDAPYDAARYAAKSGRHDEALRLLNDVIDRQPNVMVIMYADSDLEGARHFLPKLTDTKLAEVRSKVLNNTALLRDAILSMQNQFSKGSIQVTLPIDVGLVDDVNAEAQAISTDYLTLLELERTTEQNCHAGFQFAQDAFDQRIHNLKQEVGTLESRIGEINSAVHDSESRASRELKEASDVWDPDSEGCMPSIWIGLGILLAIPTWIMEAILYHKVPSFARTLHGWGWFFMIVGAPLCLGALLPLSFKAIVSIVRLIRWSRFKAKAAGAEAARDSERRRSHPSKKGLESDIARAKSALFDLNRERDRIMSGIQRSKYNVLIGTARHESSKLIATPKSR